MYVYPITIWCDVDVVHVCSVVLVWCRSRSCVFHHAYVMLTWLMCVPSLYDVMLTLCMCVPSWWCDVGVVHVCLIMMVWCWSCSCVFHHDMMLCLSCSCVLRHVDVILKLFMCVPPWLCGMYGRLACSIMVWCYVGAVHVCYSMIWCAVDVIHVSLWCTGEVVHVCLVMMVWCWMGSRVFPRDVVISTLFMLVSPWHGVILTWFMFVPSLWCIVEGVHVCSIMMVWCWS